jgi:hypothetical protein
MPSSVNNSKTKKSRSKSIKKNRSKSTKKTMSLKYNIRKNEKFKNYIYFNPKKMDKLDDIKILLEHDNNIHVYPNSDNSTPPNYYKNIKDYIDRIINNSEFLCKGLNPDYVLNSFKKVDAILIIGSLMNILPNGNIFGFALINFDEKHNAIYIDVICSHIGTKTVGDILINVIEDISKKLIIEKIYLKSVHTAISFYEKYGFVKKEELCKDMCLMIKTVK